MKDIRIGFFGTTEFSYAILDALVKNGYNVVLAVAQPDRPSGRKKEIKPTPVHQYCIDHNLNYLGIEKLRIEYEKVLEYEPELIVTCAYGQIVPDSILDYPKYGCLNVHPSLLPKYRGGAPIHHAILNGDSETGVSIIEMVSKMDAGDIYAQCCIPLGEDETTEELTHRLIEASVNLLIDTLPKYLNNQITPVIQDEELVTIGRNISKEEEMVHFENEDVNTAYNHIRALIDWPISYGVIDGKRIKFYKARKTMCEHDYKNGEIIDFSNKSMNIACKGGIIHIYELQAEGKSKMDAQSFYNGSGKSLIGKCFE